MPDIIDKIIPVLNGDAKVAMVIDATVDKLYGDAIATAFQNRSIDAERIVVESGEKAKTIDGFAYLVGEFARRGIDRDGMVIAIGGGTIGDLAGFAAASFMRGIDFIQVPTTLLAMVDSSIGGKTGIDIAEGKNLVGAFHLPKLIVRDIGFLATLPRKEMMNGFAEMIKTAILFDPVMFELMLDKGPDGLTDELPYLVERCAELKSAITAIDFREDGKRALLNLGHTFGHAIEKVSGYAIPHGEAVAMGLRIVGRDIPEISLILDRFNYPSADELDANALADAIVNDKKRHGNRITLVVPRRIGECELTSMPLSDIRGWLA